MNPSCASRFLPTGNPAALRGGQRRSAMFREIEEEVRVRSVRSECDVSFGSSRAQALFLCARDHGLDVDNRSSVDRFDGSDPQAILRDRADDDRMETQRIRPVFGARREYAANRVSRVGPRMNAKDVAAPSVEPSDDEDFVPDRKTLEPFRESGVDFEPRVGRPFRALLGRLARYLERGPDPADRPQ